MATLRKEASLLSEEDGAPERILVYPGGSSVEKKNWYQVTEKEAWNPMEEA
jgi:hypothetical protein